MGDIVTILRTAIRQQVPSDVTFNDDTDFQKLGIDSQSLIEVILAVEDSSNLAFNPDGQNWDTGVSILKLARAFTAES